MASVRQSGTSLERNLGRILDSLGLQYETNVRLLPGSPDFANWDEKWVVFAHGCFWHAHAGCPLATTPRSNVTFWHDKLKRNRKRDDEKVKSLQGKGYSVLTVWQCELKDESMLKKRIVFFLRKHELSRQESFHYTESRLSVKRRLRSGRDEVHMTSVRNRAKAGRSILSAHEAFDYSYLRSRSRPIWNRYDGQPVRIVDMFCGCGGLSLGAVEACRALERNWLIAGAIDTNSDCLRVFKRNLPWGKTYERDVTELVNGEIGLEPTLEERGFLDEIGEVDILLAGPPCQGYSDLNNITRRNDERNILYERVARLVEIAKPKKVLIENVPAVRL